MIVDGAKEIRLGEFVRKATCYFQGTEPYSPLSNFTEHKIRELKEGCSQETDSVRCTQVAVVLWAGVQILCSIAHCT